ncbi:MAG: hypothetical protein AMJ54_12575 [Deltaproteobacteria bacterium SG8_13]|nr:MAG: hypothetical protein AMJ54_12575 [Deltaproteobacteria bacterium SG8_13]
MSKPVNHPIVALWTYPRTISTAFERVMMERGDFEVFHEPFSYLYYVHENAASIAQEHIDPNHPTTYSAIKQMLLYAAEKRPVFFKDMAAHCAGPLLADPPFIARVTHTFLIRDPAKTIASYYAMNPNVTLSEIGCEQLQELFAAVERGQPQPPVVVDADDLEDSPAGIVEAYCRRLAIDFMPSSLQWQPQLPAKWKIWQKWHADAAGSTGIRKNVETFAVTPDNSAHLKSYYEHHLPFYRAMHRCRIGAVDS